MKDLITSPYGQLSGLHCSTRILGISENIQQLKRDVSLCHPICSCRFSAGPMCGRELRYEYVVTVHIFDLIPVFLNANEFRY